jgi:hypothetical protein
MVALCSLVAIGAIFMSMLLFTDVDSPSPSFYGWFCIVFLLIAAWPLALSFLVLHGDPPAIVIFLLFIISGFFWAAVVDLFCELRKKHAA